MISNDSDEYIVIEISVVFILQFFIITNRDEKSQFFINKIEEYSQTT